jgi:hypothetical protein
MRYFLTLTTFFLLTVISVFPATITGTVTDASNGKPLESASVFIAGTTFGTNTQADGSFSLTFTPSGSAQVVIAHLGYQTYTKNAIDFIAIQPVKVELPIKSMQLASVSVYGYDSNRKKNMAEFLFGFFGDSEFGKNCTILNPKVLHLMRKPIPGKIGEDELCVSADSDLFINNKLLGYTIRYTLESFVQSNYATTFNGYPLYIDNLSSSKNQERTLAYRERAYLGSQMHFFRCLYTKKLQEEGFKVYKVEKQSSINIFNTHFGLMADTVFVPEPNQHMVQTETPLNLYQYLYSMDKSAALLYSEPFEVRYTLNGEDKAYGKHVLYYNGMNRTIGQQTSITKLENDNVVFYPNGACKNAGSLITIGYWSFKKAAEIMPWDYQPSQTANKVVTLH